MPWQTYVFNVTFMYQGLLLLISACIACLSFYLSVSLFLSLSDKIYITVISGGDLVTRLITPLFVFAVVFSALLLVMLLLSSPLSNLFLKWFASDTPEKDTRSFNLKRRIRMSVAHFYAFSVMVYLLWLYSAAVFSLTLKNGTIEYVFIFFSLGILTLLAKRLVSYPVYVGMQRQIDKEKKRRNDTAILLDRDEGENYLNTYSKLLSREEFPTVYACAERAARPFHYKIDEIEVIFGSSVSDNSLAENTRKIKLTLGVVPLCVLNEKQLEATLTAYFVKLKNGSGKTLNKFLTFNAGLEFCTSRWNPLDRIYAPMTELLFAEANECIGAVNTSIHESIEKYTQKAGEHFLCDLCTASLKKAIYVFVPFAYSKSFYHPLIKGDTPVDNYNTRLSEQYLTYVEKNKKKLCDVFCAITGKNMQFSDFDADKIVDCIKNDKIDLPSRPEGKYADEVHKISATFDSYFALLVGPHYEKKSEQLYKKKIKRLTDFENTLLSGKDKPIGEKISAAEDYVSLMMPEAAIDVLRDVGRQELSSNARLNLVLGEAMLRLGDVNGLAALEAAARLNYRCAYKALTTAERLLAANGYVDEYTSLNVRFRDSVMQYLQNDPDTSHLSVMDDLTGEYKLTDGVTVCTSFSDEEKKKIADSVVEICTEDRFEWAALLNVKKGEKNIPTLIVRCSEIHPGGYTDSYRDGVYAPSVDNLLGEIRNFGDTYPKPLAARLVYDAETEAFEALEGAIICRRGSIEARKILSHELSAFLDGEEDNDYIPFRDEEDTDEIDSNNESDKK